MTLNYTAGQIRDAARVLYAMTPGTCESEAAHTQMLEWAERVDGPRTAGQAAFTARHPDRSWWAQTDADRERWERTAAAAIEFASEPTEMAAAPGPLKVGDTVLVLPRAGQEYLAFHIAVVAGVVDARVTVHVPGEGDDVFTVHRDSLLVRGPFLDLRHGYRVFVPRNAQWGTPAGRVRPGIRGYDADVESGRVDTDGDLYVRSADNGAAGYVRAGQVFPADAVERAVQGATS